LSGLLDAARAAGARCVTHAELAADALPAGDLRLDPTPA
jgi:hypothetical protein